MFTGFTGDSDVAGTALAHRQVSGNWDTKLLGHMQPVII